MREYIIGKDDRGQRLDKYLKRRLPLAPSSFIYKMLRKKNITLRGKKADGSEKVAEGDSVILYLSDETIEKFSSPVESGQAGAEAEEEARAFRLLQPVLGKDPVLYEDENILIVRKPAGVLSQKAAAGDLSMNEWLRGYLRQKAGPDGPGPQSAGFRPSVCNRLDRNTGGILLCARSLQGSRALSFVIRKRLIRKTYHMLVHGRITGPGRVEGSLIKDRDHNLVRAASKGTDADAAAAGQAAVTVYRPVRAGKNATLTEADLITGRSHQLRVHMASLGHPILFDPKYGDRERDLALLRSAGIRLPAGAGRAQLLWCVETAFPDRFDPDPEEDFPEEVLLPLRGRVFRSPEPDWWGRLLSEGTAEAPGRQGNGPEKDRTEKFKTEKNKTEKYKTEKNIKEHKRQDHKRKVIIVTNGKKGNS